MRIEFLGSGGAATTPRPNCFCRVCTQARELGAPYSRSGPSLFVHGPDVLIDTPEEIKDQLNRSSVSNISACIYSHWHPDHTLGLRVWETRNSDDRNWPPQHERTDIYLPQQVGIDFRERLGLWDQFSFLEKKGYVRVKEVADGEVIEIKGVRIRPFRLAEDYVYAFLLEEDRSKVLIAPDELHGWQPPRDLSNLDLAVLPMGVVEYDPFSGERRIHPENPVLTHEATFEETLAVARRLDAKRIVVTHIDYLGALTYDDLKSLETRLRADGLAIEFAYDKMMVDVA